MIHFVVSVFMKLRDTAYYFLVTSVEEIEEFYEFLLQQVKSGATKSEALKKCNKDFTSLRRVAPIIQLKVTRPDKFREVSLFIDYLLSIA